MNEERIYKRLEEKDYWLKGFASGNRKGEKIC